jgi:RNA polymerase sigma-70 factor (ECF subfamily)
MKFDKSFIKRLKKKDKKAQELFYQQLAPQMYGICIRFSANRADADDILQEGFIRVFTNLNGFRGEGSIEGWVRKTIVNTAINFYKKRIKRGISVELDYIKINPNRKSFIIEKMAADDLLELIRNLPDGYRTVFNLNVIEGYTHKEIGEMLEISENTSKSQLSRAKAMLKRRINPAKNKDING